MRSHTSIQRTTCIMIFTYSYVCTDTYMLWRQPTGYLLLPLVSMLCLLGCPLMFRMLTLSSSGPDNSTVSRVKRCLCSPPVTFLGGADIRGLRRQLGLQTHASTCCSWSVFSHPALLRLLKRPLGQWVSSLPRKNKRRDTECHQDWLHCKEVRVKV